MRKLLIALVLAGVVTLPSAVLTNPNSQAPLRNPQIIR